MTSFLKTSSTHPATLRLENGARVAVMGGGPAGSLFAYFLLDLAARAGLNLHVDIYEPRDFSQTGPQGCNMCAGIVSESLIQILALDGINLPPEVVQRGMDSYLLHNDAGQARLDTPDLERRIGAVYRGAGPKGSIDRDWISFDGFLLEHAVEKGANLVRKRVDSVERLDGRIQIGARGEKFEPYDFLAVATGVNTSALRLFEPLEPGFRPPELMQTYIREYRLDRQVVQEHFGQTIHFFLLDLPGLHFAAIVPKRSYVTVCLLGHHLTQEVFDTFLNTPHVRNSMPPEWQPGDYACDCSPRINVTGAVPPFAERMVFLGDSGISRLYKDGLGAAYRAAKAAASAAVFSGIAEQDLRQYYGRSSQRMENDNRAGKLIFGVVDIIKPWRFIARALLRMIASEQPKPAPQRRMSNIIWDMFTGSAPYRDILYRMLHPAFWSRFIWYIGVALVTRS